MILLNKDWHPHAPKQARADKGVLYGTIDCSPGQTIICFVQREKPGGWEYVGNYTFSRLVDADMSNDPKPTFTKFKEALKQNNMQEYSNQNIDDFKKGLVKRRSVEIKFVTYDENIYKTLVDLKAYKYRNSNYLGRFAPSP